MHSLGIIRRNNADLILSELAAKLLSGPGTFRAKTGERDTHATGFYVGGAVPGLKDPSYSEIKDWLRHLAPRFVLNLDPTVDPGENGLVGSWTSDEGVTYIDAVTWTPFRATALRLGKERGEMAVWDIANEEAVEVDHA